MANVLKRLLSDRTLDKSCCCSCSGAAGAAEEEDDDDVPDLVENFDEASKGEEKVKSEGTA